MYVDGSVEESSKSSVHVAHISRHGTLYDPCLSSPTSHSSIYFCIDTDISVFGQQSALGISFNNKTIQVELGKWKMYIKWFLNSQYCIPMQKKIVFFFKKPYRYTLVCWYTADSIFLQFLWVHVLELGP